MKGYRVRVTVDYAIFSYDEQTAIQQAKAQAEQSSNARWIDVKIIKTTEPDVRKIMEENK